MLLEEKNIFYLNYGDYISNKISIEYDSKKGLKLICKENSFIKKGELILAEKAIVCKKIDSNNSNINAGKKETNSINLEMNNK